MAYRVHPVKQRAASHLCRLRSSHTTSFDLVDGWESIFAVLPATRLPEPSRLRRCRATTRRSHYPELSIDFERHPWRIEIGHIAVRNEAQSLASRAKGNARY